MLPVLNPKEQDMTKSTNSANTRAPYVPPKLEVLPKFNAVIGCSVAGGCLPINSSLVTKIIEGRS
jgi:hypothetical protein